MQELILFQFLNLFKKYKDIIFYLFIFFSLIMID
jgi:hypothetical protein